MTRIDILLASYNSEKYIEAQIDSIIAQNYPHIHLFIQDDNSQDRTPFLIQQKIQQHPNHITFFKSQKNRGVIGNFSELMQHSQAEYIMFSDHDDIWLPNKISQTLKTMRDLEIKHGSSVPLLVHTDLALVDEGLRPIAPSFWQHAGLKTHKSATLNRLLTQNMITGCTMMINRALLMLATPIPEGVLMHDWWLGLTAAAFGHIAALPETTMLYRQHQSNYIGAKDCSLRSHAARLLAAPKKYRESICKSHEKRYRQAQVFHERFFSALPNSQQKTISGFLELHHSGFLKRGYLVLRHQLYKNGILRTLRDIFLSV